MILDFLSLDEDNVQDHLAAVGSGARARWIAAPAAVATGSDIRARRTAALAAAASGSDTRAPRSAAPSPTVRFAPGS